MNDLDKQMQEMAYEKYENIKKKKKKKKLIKKTLVSKLARKSFNLKLLKLFSYFFVLVFLILFLDFKFQKYFNISYANNSSQYILIYILVIFSIVKYYIKCKKMLNKLSSICIFSIISALTSDFIFKIVFNYDVLFTFSGIVILFFYLIFIGNFTYFTYNNYILNTNDEKQKHQENLDKQIQEQIKKKKSKARDISNTNKQNTNTNTNNNNINKKSKNRKNTNKKNKKNKKKKNK